ncbi:MAG TPA: Gfo/Idh/MocA family oxidoreductase [Bryobacteraceae bacterium]|nr:Gfo/Idh/MocA family oxidoreductase [Bryobacteraceae bacterium]
MSDQANRLTRRAVLGAFSIVPAHVLGKSAPSNLVQVAQIGCGRIARSMEFPGLLRNSATARIVAVCDLDTVRLADAKSMIEKNYAGKFGTSYTQVKTYGDYREMLQDSSIDAVAISTPDHWHAQPAIEAALAGKDVFLQKPASLTIAEGRLMADTIVKTGRIFQQGSQQRSDPAFRLACELILNGRIGKVLEVFVGLPTDPAGGNPSPMPVPSNLNYDAWIGATPVAPYCEDRVHPQSPDIKKRYERPGWLRLEQFGAGMITGWGAHHIDTAHLAMGLEHSGPVEIVADASFPKEGLWDVHGSYHVRMKYPNGATMFISDKFENGVRFIGESGWIWVTRGRYTSGQGRSQTISSSDERWLKEGIKDGEVRLHVSPNNDHHLDWIESIKSRKSPVAPAEDGHRSCSACLLAHAAMKTGRTLKWDVKAERFIGDEKANKLLSRPERTPYGAARVLAR